MHTNDNQQAILDELLVYFDIAKSMMTIAIHDLDSKSKSKKRSAEDWFFNENLQPSLSLEACCTIINTSLDIFYKDSTLQLTKELIREKIKYSDNRQKIVKALQAKRLSLLDEEADLDLFYYGVNPSFSDYLDSQPLSI